MLPPFGAWNAISRHSSISGRGLAVEVESLANGTGRREQRIRIEVSWPYSCASPRTSRGGAHLGRSVLGAADETARESACVLAVAEGDLAGDDGRLVADRPLDESRGARRQVEGDLG